MFFQKKKKYEQNRIPVGNDYEIHVIYNDERGLVGKVYKKGIIKMSDTEFPGLTDYVGEVYTYFDYKPDSEEARLHWKAELYFKEKFVKKEVGQLIGDALLKHTACKEPLLLGCTTTVDENDKTKYFILEFGQVYDDE